MSTADMYRHHCEPTSTMTAYGSIGVRMVAILCQDGHVIGTVPVREWAGSTAEATMGRVAANAAQREDRRRAVMCAKDYLVCAVCDHIQGSHGRAEGDTGCSGGYCDPTCPQKCRAFVLLVEPIKPLLCTVDGAPMRPAKWPYTTVDDTWCGDWHWCTTERCPGRQLLPNADMLTYLGHHDPTWPKPPRGYVVVADEDRAVLDGAGRLVDVGARVWVYPRNRSIEATVTAVDRRFSRLHLDESATPIPAALCLVLS